MSTEALPPIDTKHEQGGPPRPFRLLPFVSRGTVSAVSIANRLKWSVAGPDSRIVAIGTTALVCWFSALAFQWVQHLVAGRNPTLWHPAGVGVALLLLWGYRVWPGIAIAALVTLLPIASLSPSFLVVAIAGALFDTVGTAFLTRLFSGHSFQTSLTRVRDVGALVSAIFITTAVRAALGLAMYVFGSWGTLDGLWLRWLTLWHGGVLGIILFAPLVLVWSQTHRPRAGRALEAAALSAGLIVIGIGAFADLPPELALSLVYLVFPLMAWSAIRFQQRGAVTAGTIATSIVVLSAYGGHSPVIGSASFAPFALWLPVEISAVSALFISATVTERERALRDARQLAMILHATPDLVAVADRDMKLRFLNRAGRHLLGFEERTSIDGLKIADLHPDEDFRKIETVALPQAVEAGTWRGETAFRRRDGRTIPFSQVIVSRKNRAGEVTHFATIGRDIAQQKEQETQLRQAQKMDAIGRLAAGVAHDFNNLLTVIRGNCEISLPMLAQNHPVRDSLVEIEDAGKRATELTTQLLAFSRQQVTRPQPLDLNQVVRSIFAMLTRLLGENIKLELLTAEHLDMVLADSGMMDQIILNLSINARDAMPDGGTLTIRSEMVDVAASSEKSGFQVPAGRYVMLAISDNGVGMSEQTIAHLFEPFFTTKSVGKGTGLGLATVYGIVKQNNGFITVESELGRGSTFRVYLPPTVSVQPAKTAPDSAGVNVVQRGSILLVEDEERLRELLRRHLSARGYFIVTARDGIEGLAICEDRAYVPDLLLTDVVMPGMSGRELAEKLRTHHPSLKVLFITGYTEEKIVRQGALPSGMACLNKPFELRVLEQKIRETLDAV